MTQKENPNFSSKISRFHASISSVISNPKMRNSFDLYMEESNSLGKIVDKIRFLRDNGGEEGMIDRLKMEESKARTKLERILAKFQNDGVELEINSLQQLFAAVELRNDHHVRIERLCIPSSHDDHLRSLARDLGFESVHPSHFVDEDILIEKPDEDLKFRTDLANLIAGDVTDGDDAPKKLSVEEHYEKNIESCIVAALQEFVQTLRKPQNSEDLEKRLKLLEVSINKFIQSQSSHHTCLEEFVKNMDKFSNNLVDGVEIKMVALDITFQVLKASINDGFADFRKEVHQQSDISRKQMDAMNAKLESSYARLKDSLIAGFKKSSLKMFQRLEEKMDEMKLSLESSKTLEGSTRVIESGDRAW